MKTTLLKVLPVFLLLTSQLVMAQVKTVTGNVSDENGLPLPGVNVIVQDTQTGTQTDFDGNYSLSVNGGKNLVFSYLGYKTAVKTVGVGITTLSFSMEPDAASLDEVVVTGYGTTIKRKLTEAISSVTSEDIKEVPNANFQNALIGKLSGVQIQQNNGKAEGKVTFTIRGLSSLNGNQEPLFVVDGVPILNNQESSTSAPTNPLVNINPNDIESVQILKDASSAAIYGSRGTNGVVLITTKKGKSGRLKVNFNSSYGVSEATNTREFLNTAQYAELFTEATVNSGGTVADAEATLDDLATDSNGFTNDWRNSEVDTNWTDLALVEGYVQENNVSVSGGSENSQFYMSLGNNNTQGIVRGNELERYNFRLNAQTSVTDKFKAGASVQLAKSEIDRIAADRQFTTPLQAIAQVPLSSPYNQDGTINRNTLYENFLAEEAFTFYVTNVWNMGGNAFAEYNLLPELSFRSELGYEHFEQLEENFRGPESDFQGSDNGQGFYNNVTRDFYSSSNYFTFDKTFADKHNVTSTLGMSYEETRRRSLTASGIDYANPLIVTLAGAGTIDSGDSRRSSNNLVSYFGRVAYDYEGKYLLKGGLRVDGSSRFGPNNRYGYFPSVSAGWVISREGFMEDSNLFSNLKLRGSYGITGNQPVGNFEYVSLVNIGAYEGIPNSTLGQAGDPNLKWEETTQYDVGLNFGLYDNRITGELDYYVKDTEDLLLQAPVALSNGVPGNSILSNVGRIENKGVEFTLNTSNIEKENFQWNSSFNISYNKNEVLELAGDQDEFIAQNNIIRVGESVADFFLVEYAGVDPDNGDALYFLNTELPDGSLDRTTTNVYNDAEQVILGNPFPDVVAGLTNTFAYKNLDLTVTFQGQYGASIYNSGGRFQQSSFAFRDNQGIEALDRWQNPGDITDEPQLRRDGSNGGVDSSRYLQEADFIRLRNVTLGYNFLDKGPFSSLRVYVTGLNLATFTDYTGYDPEATQDDQLSSIARGQEFYSAPPARTITFGINAQF